MAANTSVSVTLLTAMNYATWRVKCQMALMKDGLWNIVNETEASPDGSNADKLAKFLQRSDKALATIVLSIDSSLLYLLGEPTSSVEVWKKLANHFQKKSWVNKLYLRKKLYSLKLEDGCSVQDHIRVMTETFNALSAVGDSISDEDRVVHLLASLPESYSMLVTALEVCSEVPKMEVVMERLLHEERKVADSESSHRSRSRNGENAMMVSRQKKSKDLKCYYCHKVGHIRRDCHALKNKQKDQNKSSHNAHSTRTKGRSDSDADSDCVGLTVSHALSTCDVDPSKWIIDSGATCHMCNDRSLFTDFVELERPIDVTLGDGHNLKGVGRGTVTLEIDVPQGKMQKCKLRDVLCVPNLSYNLLSVSKAADAVEKAVFTKTGCELKFDRDVVATGKRVGELYYLNCRKYQQAATVTQRSDESPEELWHRRYGHLGLRNMKKLVVENMVVGLDCDMKTDIGICEPCVEGKQHRTKFPTSGGKRSNFVLGLVHSDVCGKMSTQSLGGGEYFLTFIDDKTRHTWMYILKHKDEVFERFLEWKALAEKCTGVKLKALRTDNGGEYTSNAFEDYLRKEGIQHELTVPKNPEQNGVAERMNRTIVETARSMLSEAKLPRNFWAEAVSTAVYLRNRSPTTAVEGMTPYESLTGQKPCVDTFRVFGCLAYAHIPKDERKKFDSKTRKCIFLGYGTTTKGYRLYDVTRRKVIFSRDVIFDESKPKIEEESEVPLRHAVQVDLNGDVECDEPLMRRSTRERHPPNMYGEWVTLTCDSAEPSSVLEATSGSNSDKWRSAMKAEMDSLIENEVWDLVERPKDRKTIGSKWVFKEKVGADGSVERYKARLVAQGYSQQYGLDYDETFSPVVRGESVRTVIAMAAKNNLVLHQMDVTTAFLNGTLKEEVYMKQPEGFVTKGKEHLVCKLKKSIYGLKQSPRCWNAALDGHLRKIGFIQSTSDPCIYTADEGLVILAVYVDDIILAAKSEQHLNKVKQAIADKFTVQDMGELRYFLGVTIDQKTNSESIWMGQPGYTQRILKKFNMDEAKPVSTPVDTSVKLTKAEEENETVDQGLYQSAVGSLLYLSMWTRPDITYAVSNVSKFCSKPCKEHWTAVKRIMRYLKGTIDYGLWYDKNTPSECVGYSDSDWAGDTDDRKSTSGYVFQICGAAVSWRSKKQSCVAISTAEAEYIALASAAQEAVWMQQLIGDLEQKSEKPMLIYEDNQSAICMTKNPQFHGRAKHISIKYHFIREQVEKGTVTLKYCPSENMIADMLTKGLSKEQFYKLRLLIGVKNKEVISVKHV
jgi:hypothetical protein